MSHAYSYDVPHLAGLLEKNDSSLFLSAPPAQAYAVFAHAAFDYHALKRAEKTRSWIDLGRTARGLLFEGLRNFTQGPGGFSSDYFTRDSTKRHLFAYDNANACAMLFYEAAYLVTQLHFLSADEYSRIHGETKKGPQALSRDPRMESAALCFFKEASRIFDKVEDVKSPVLTREAQQRAGHLFAITAQCLSANAVFLSSAENAASSLQARLDAARERSRRAVITPAADPTSPLPDNHNVIFVRPTVEDIRDRAESLDYSILAPSGAAQEICAPPAATPRPAATIQDISTHPLFRRPIRQEGTEQGGARIFMFPQP